MEPLDEKLSGFFYQIHTLLRRFLNPIPVIIGYLCKEKYFSRHAHQQNRPLCS
jgi:hypothetical protein